MMMLLTILVMSGLFLTTTFSSRSLVSVHAEKRYLAARMVGEILGMRADQRGLELNTRNHQIAKVAQVKQSYRQHYANAVDALSAYQALGGSPEETSAVSEAHDALQAANNYVERLIPLCEAGDADGAAAVSAGNLVSPFDKAIKPANQLASFSDANLKTAIAAADSNSHWMMLGAAFTILIGLVTVGFTWYTLRTGAKKLLIISTTMATGAAQVASTSTQIAHTAQSLANEASQQAERVQSTAANSAQADAVATRTSSDSTTAVELVDRTMREVTQSVERVRTLSESMLRIEGTTKTITGILQTIEQIALQTNLLALNAAVEASRAGVAGAGFAVVADEVGRLAQLCTQSSTEMARQIADAAKSSSDGRRRVDDVTASIKAVHGCSTELKTLLTRVSSGAAAQSSNLHSINSEIGAMEQITQRTAAAAEESAAASGELSSQAGEMHLLADSLRGFVGAH